MSTTTHAISSPGFSATVTTSFSTSDSSHSSSGMHVPGGYMPGTINADTTALLAKALGNDTLYGEDVTTRVCFSAIDSVTEQVVAGSNYKYVVDACTVSKVVEGQGKCSSELLAACKPEKYTITVFEQTWTNTLAVSEIKAGSAQESTGSTANEAKDKDTAVSPGNSSTTPSATKSAGRRTSLGVAAVLAATLAVSIVVV